MLSKEKRDRFNQRFKNTTKYSLNLNQRDGMLMGWTDNYVRVAVPYHASLVNSLVSLPLKRYTSRGYYEEEIKSDILDELSLMGSVVNEC